MKTLISSFSGFGVVDIGAIPGGQIAAMRPDNKSHLTERQRELLTRPTRDIGGAASTDGFADAIIEKMG